MSAPTLKDQLLALCDQHELTHLSIAVYTLDTGERFIGAAAHGGGKCGSNSGQYDRPEEAVANAIGDLNAKRHSVVVPELVPA